MRRVIGQALFAVAVLAMVLFLVFPIYVMFITSVKSYSEIFRSPPTWIPAQWHWGNYAQVWRSLPLLTLLRNSAIVAVSTVTLNLLVSFPAAYALARYRFRGNQLVRLLMLFTQMLSPVIVLIPLFQILKLLHLINSLPGLILVQLGFTSAFTVWLLIGFFQQIPLELEEAAIVDGASIPQVLVRIVVPTAAPGIFASAMYAFITVWSDFVFAFTLISSESKKLVTVGLFDLAGARVTHWELLMGAALIAVVPTFAIFLYMRRFLVSGGWSGAIK
jgi:multiple sugar transport system permease protein